MTAWSFALNSTCAPSDCSHTDHLLPASAKSVRSCPRSDSWKASQSRSRVGSALEPLSCSFGENDRTNGVGPAVVTPRRLCYGRLVQTLETWHPPCIPWTDGNGLKPADPQECPSGQRSAATRTMFLRSFRDALKGNFVPATNVRLVYNAEGFHSYAQSACELLLLLPVQFSHCWTVSGSGEASFVSRQHAAAWRAI
jgi:hypothetical protein